MPAIRRTSSARFKVRRSPTDSGGREIIRAVGGKGLPRQENGRKQGLHGLLSGGDNWTFHGLTVTTARR